MAVNIVDISTLPSLNYSAFTGGENILLRTSTGDNITTIGDVSNYTIHNLSITYAALNGNSSIVFNVANATDPQNAVPLLQHNQASIGLNGITSLNGNTVLTDTNSGQILVYNGVADGSFTLPYSNSAAANTLLMTIYNNSSNNLTVLAQSGNAIVAISTVLSEGQSGIFINDGQNTWYSIINTAGVLTPPEVISLQNSILAEIKSIANNPVYTPTGSEVLPVPNTNSTAPIIVMPGVLTANIILTLPTGIAAGTEYIIYGSDSNFTVTVRTSVSAGNPNITFSDESTAYSWVIPASSSTQCIKLVFGGTNWRAETFGQKVVANAAANNQAVALGQLLSGDLSPVFSITEIANATATTQAVALGQLLNSSISPAFSNTVVANAIAGNQAVALNQFLPPFYNQASMTIVANFSQTVSVSFTMPCNGRIFAMGGLNQNTAATKGISLGIYINGVLKSGDNTLLSKTLFSANYFKAGEAITVAVTASATTSPGTVLATCRVGAIIIPQT